MHTAALFPARVHGLVTVDGYNIQDIAHTGAPAAPEWERAYGYQYCFHSERGPGSTATGTSSANCFGARGHRSGGRVCGIPYRQRFGLVDGHPRYQWLDDLIAQEPRIIVPTVALEGGDKGVSGPSAAEDREYFRGRYEHRLLRGWDTTDAVASLLV